MLTPQIIIANTFIERAKNDHHKLTLSELNILIYLFYLNTLIELKEKLFDEKFYFDTKKRPYLISLETNYKRFTFSNDNKVKIKYTYKKIKFEDFGFRFDGQFHNLDFSTKPELKPLFEKSYYELSQINLKVPNELTRLLNKKHKEINKMKGK